MCVILDYLGKGSLNENQIGIDGSVRLCHLKFIIEDENEEGLAYFPWRSRKRRPQRKSSIPIMDIE